LKISVVVPVYNEKNTIREIVRRIQQVSLEKEIIIVDDYSTDGTREILKGMEENTLKILFHDKNQGKGAALRTGFQEVIGDIVIIQDADLEYNPQEYSILIQPILEGKADAVYGSRFSGGPHRVLLFWHYVGNKFLTTLSNMFTNLNLTDMETCYKAFRSSLLKNIDIKSKRFGFEPEITAKLAKLKCRIYEVPISYSGRDYSEGKKINWKDGIAAFFWIIRYNIFS
jgi:glycosyltransferase involved in cell wall biosynthesis